MQQFGPQFINFHLMPLLEEMLTDTAQRKKDYLDKLFINGTLEAIEKKNLMDYYFNPVRKNEGVPFVGEEEQKEREIFLNYFVDYMASRGAKPADRIRAFLPVVNQKSEGPVKEVTWPADVKRNLFLMSYHIAEHFEKDQINNLILAKEAAGKTEEAKKDRELLEKGMLMLVKDPATGEFNKYIRATELKTGQTEVQFLPPPPQEMAELLKGGFAIPSMQTLQSIGQGASSPQTVSGASKYMPEATAGIPDQVSSNEELTKSFQQKRGTAITNLLQKEGFQVTGEVQFDTNGHAMVKVKSGTDNLLVSADTRVPFDQDLKLNFTFQTGAAAGKSFAVEETKLHEAFTKADGSKRTARELYDDIDLCRKLGIQSDAYPQKAPQKPQPVPKVELPGPQGQGVPFKLPPGQVPGKIPTGLPGGLKTGLEGGAPLKLPTEGKAPEMPKAQGGKEKERGIGYKIKTRPVPGIPAKSVMEAKSKLKAQKQAEEEGQQGQAGASAPPLAPGRVNEETLAPPPPPQKKGNPLAKVAVGHALGIGTAIGSGWWLGSVANTPASSPNTAWHMVHTFMIALTQYLPHFFG